MNDDGGDRADAGELDGVPARLLDSVQNEKADHNQRIKAKLKMVLVGYEVLQRALSPSESSRRRRLDGSEEDDVA